jgi:acyl carrier protein
MLERFEKVLKEHRGDATLAITPETVLADLGLDSLDMAELIMDLEDEFSVTLETDDSIKTVADLMAQIQAQLELKEQ